MHSFFPMINDDKLLSPTAVLVGEVSIGNETVVGNNSVLKGDLNRIIINTNTIIQDNCSLNTVSQLDKTGQEAMLSISGDCLIMSGSTLTSCDIDPGVTVGPNSVIAEGARIGEHTVIGPNSVVPPYRYIPGHQVWAGNPVRFVKDLSKREVTSFRVLRDGMTTLENQIASRLLRESTAYMQKEMLDDLEFKMKDESLSIEDLQETLDTLENLGFSCFFEKDLIAQAKKRLGN